MILRHGAAYLATTATAAVLGLGTTLLLTRLLGPEAFGVYGLGQSIGTFVLYAAFEWLTWVVAPMVAARAGTDAAVARTLRRLFAWASVAAVLAALCAVPFVAPGLRWPLLAAGVSALALGYFQLAAQFAVIRLTPGRYAAMNLARSAGTFGAVVGAALLGAPVAVLLAGPAVGAVLGLAAGGQGGRQRGAGGPEAPSVPVGTALRLGAPLAAVFALYAVQLSADRWIIEAMAGTASLGQYVAASMTMQAPLALLSSSIGMAALPLALAAARQGGGAPLEAQLRSNFALLAGLMTPAAIGLACVASRLAPSLVGAAFVAGTVALAPWLCVAALVGALRANYLDHAFYIAARTRPQAAVMAVLAAVQVGATLALVPALGLKGAAVADIAGNLVAGGLSAWYGRRVCRLPVPWRDMLAIGAGCAAMVAALELIEFPQSLVGAVGQIAVGVVVYSTLVACFDLAGLGRFLLARLRRRQPVDGAVLLGLIGLLALGACSPRPPDAVAPTLTVRGVATQDYVLQPGDEIEIRFFDVPQLDDRVAVRPDGRVSLQLVGDVPAAGRTIAELHDAVAAKYQGVLKNPQLSLAVRTVAPQRVFVDGEVERPGLIETADRITLEMAIAQAGGIKTSARAGQVVLIRRPEVGTRPRVSVLDLSSVRDGTDLSQDVELATNDIIFVPRSPIGEVNKFVDLYLRQNIPVTFGYSIP